MCDIRRTMAGPFPSFRRLALVGAFLVALVAFAIGYRMVAHAQAASVQGKLLRVIEEREVMATGAEAPRTLDLRIVAAAKEDLSVAVTQGRFRADLLYRLDAAVQARLADHDWPGNVRELRNFAQRVMLDVDVPIADDAAPDATLPERVERFEASVLRATLEQAGGDVKQALALLGILRKTFYDKLTRHGIDIDAYRG